jgi:6-phosphofructokinase 1
MSESPSTISKDLEGVSDTFDQPPPPPPPAGGAAGTKQRKIAVLTSGGDSAGMNAAGESIFAR